MSLCRRGLLAGWLAVGLLCSLPVAAQQVQAPYRDYLSGFEFVPPPGWQLFESKTQVGQVTLTIPSARAFILISVEPRPGQKDDGKPATAAQLAQIARVYHRKLSRSSLAKLYSDFKVVSREPGLIGTLNSAQILYAATARTAKAPAGQVLICLGGDLDRLVTVTLIAPRPGYERLQPSLGQVISTFRLL